MTEMVSYCGYRCDLCAARSDDPAVRQRLVDGWHKYLVHQHYTAENVRCDGCRSNGRLADQICKVRPCAIARRVESCAFCEDFVCDKVGSLLSERLGMLIFLHRRMAEITQEEYNLCIRQFESMPNVVKMWVRAGKLPDWVIEDEKSMAWMVKDPYRPDLNARYPENPFTWYCHCGAGFYRP